MHEKEDDLVIHAVDSDHLGPQGHLLQCLPCMRSDCFYLRKLKADSLFNKLRLPFFLVFRPTVVGRGILYR